MNDKLKNIEREHSNSASFHALFLDDSTDVVTVQTSGSTGVPKSMKVQKERMVASARATLSFLDLKKGQTALLCLSTKYIAGMMMVVRSIVGKLDLLEVEVTGHPLASFVGKAQKIDFAAMTPMQVYNSLQVPEEKKILEQISSLIIGGGAISSTLETELQQLSGVRVFSTYGMTETLSHIAMRRVNGECASLLYQPLPGVSLAVGEGDTLRIYAPAIYPEWIQTNDVVRFEGQCFEVLGRRDNIINSGGVKVQIEQVEAAISQRYFDLQFVVTSVVDDKYGEVVVLLIQGDTALSSSAQSFDFKFLPKYSRPKHLLYVEEIPMTETGKPSRVQCKKLVNKILLKEED